MIIDGVQRWPNGLTRTEIDTFVTRMTPYRQMVKRACAEFRVMPAIVYAIIYHESRGRLAAVSTDGFASVGLMQVIPATARGMGFNPRTVASDPYQSVRCGTKYFAAMTDKFNGSIMHAFMAYAGGPGYAKGYDKLPVAKRPTSKRYRQVLGFIELVVALWPETMAAETRQGGRLS